MSQQLFMVNPILSTPRLRDLTAADQNVLYDIIWLPRSAIELSGSDKVRSLSTTFHIAPQSIRDVVVEHQHTNRSILWYITNNIVSWQYDGAKIVCRKKRLLKTLEQEGFHERVEQLMFHDYSTENGSTIRSRSIGMLAQLGMNSPEPE
ncbi:hypothetical protein BLNAU_18847 [Blattamonas nauphoetae]|uniref:Uncharacterized protein n=1 Tax=Blattamonas nauphoetae TaxID=2049346 RepID=A0ABQ9X3H6_9EUKA|nr:hypothetical protein BLNAU_18847 [Blattamonas nauphoetae]